MNVSASPEQLMDRVLTVFNQLLAAALQKLRCDMKSEAYAAARRVVGVTSGALPCFISEACLVKFC